MSSSSGLRRSVGPHRVPGICISLLGFLLLFAGIMMVAMGETIHASNYKDVKIGGSITLVLGVAGITAGFVYQYIVHRNWKRRKQVRQQRRKAAAEAEVISGRACNYYMGEDDTVTAVASGSMVDLAVDDGGEHLYQYSNHPYDDDEQQRDNSPNLYDIFTVDHSRSVHTSCADVIVHNEASAAAAATITHSTDDLRSNSVSPNIICHHVIDDLSDSDDDDLSHKKSVNGLSVDQLVDQTYSNSPRLSSQHLNDIASELEEEEEEQEVIIKPLPRKQRKKHSKNTSSPPPQTVQNSDNVDNSSSQLNNDNTMENAHEKTEVESPGIKRKVRRKLRGKSDTHAVTPHDEEGTIKQTDVKIDSPIKTSPKGKAGKGSRVKSSKGLPPKAVLVEKVVESDWDSDEKEKSDGEELAVTGSTNKDSGRSSLMSAISAAVQAAPIQQKKEEEETSDWDSISDSDITHQRIPQQESCDSRCS